MNTLAILVGDNGVQTSQSAFERFEKDGFTALLLGISYGEDGNVSLKEHLVDFIATYPKLEEVTFQYGDLFPSFRPAFDINEVRNIPRIFLDCTKATNKNPHVSRVNLAVWAEKSYLAAAGNHMSFIGNEKAMKLILAPTNNEITIEEITSFCSTVASLNNLEELFTQGSLREDLLLNLMTSLAQRKSLSTLKDLNLMHQHGGLPGVDTFLASDAASSLKRLALTIDSQATKRIMATGLSQSICLKMLKIDAGDDLTHDDFCLLANGLFRHTNVETLMLSAGGDINLDDVRMLANCIREAPTLLNLHVVFDLYYLDASVIQSMQEEILQNGMRLNNNLETAKIVLGNDVLDDSEVRFVDKLSEYCNRNVAVKASKAFTNNDSVSKLPLSTIPLVLGTFHKRCGATTAWVRGNSEHEALGDVLISPQKQYIELSSTIIYSFLRSRCGSSKIWDGIMTSLPSSPNKKRKKNVQKNVDGNEH